MSTKKSEKKVLLEEKKRVISRWGQMAGIKQLNEDKVREILNLGEEEIEDEEEMGEDPEMTGEEAPMDDMDMGAEGEDEALPPEPDMDMGDEGEGLGGGENEALVKDLVAAIADAIEGVAGVEIEVEGGEGDSEVEAELEPELDEPEAEMPAEEVPTDDMGGDSEGLEGEEEELDEGCSEKKNYNFQQKLDEIANKIAKKIVVEALAASKKKSTKKSKK